MVLFCIYVIFVDDVLIIINMCVVDLFVDYVICECLFVMLVGVGGGFLCLLCVWCLLFLVLIFVI